MERKDDPIYNFQDECFDLMLEEERPAHQGKLESFEAYAARKKAEMHKELDDYNQQLINGYELIIKKLKSKEETPKEEEKEEKTE
jgi:hypothetical protein